MNNPGICGFVMWKYLPPCLCCSSLQLWFLRLPRQSQGSWTDQSHVVFLSLCDYHSDELKMSIGQCVMNITNITTVQCNIIHIIHVQGGQNVNNYQGTSWFYFFHMNRIPVIIKYIYCTKKVNNLFEKINYLKYTQNQSLMQIISQSILLNFYLRWSLLSMYLEKKREQITTVKLYVFYHNTRLYSFHPNTSADTFTCDMI